MKEEKILHTSKLPHRLGQRGSSEPQRTVQWDRCCEGKTDDSPQRLCLVALSSREAAHITVSARSEWQLGMEAQALEVSLQGGDQGWLLWRYCEGANLTLQRQTKENAWAAREAKDHSRGRALMPCSNSIHSQNKRPYPRENQKRVSQLQSTAPEPEKQVEGQRQKARGRYGNNPRDYNYHQAISSNRSLCTSSWEPEWLSSGFPQESHSSAWMAFPWSFNGQGSHSPGSPRLGTCTTHLRVWWPSTGTSHSKHFPYTPVSSAVPLPLPSTTEQVSPNKPLLYLPCLCGEQTLERLTSRGSPQTKVECQELCKQRKEGEISQKWQVQWFKFLQLACALGGTVEFENKYKLEQGKI